MSRFVEGQDRSQVTLLPECLGDFIAEDNTVRLIDAFISELDMAALGLKEQPRQQPAVLRTIPQSC